MNPDNDRVIEIGAVIISSNGKIIKKTFNQLCKAVISPFITELTGITNEMVKDKPTPGDVMPELFEFIGDRPLIAHNASFDERFLHSEMGRVGLIVKNPFICTLLLSKRLIHGLKSYKLTVLKEVINFKSNNDQHNDHRALDDVFVTVFLWQKLYEIVASVERDPIDVYTFHDIIRMKIPTANNIYIHKKHKA